MWRGHTLIIIGWMVVQSMSDDDITMTRSAGHFTIEKMGRLMPRAGRAALVIHLDCDKAIAAIEDYLKESARHKEIKNLMKADRKEAEGLRTELVQMKHFLTTVQLSGRERRDILSWIGGLTGIYNSFGVHDVKGRLDHTNAAVRRTVLQVDALANVTQINARNMDRARDTMGRTLNMLKFVQVAQILMDEWQTIRVWTRDLRSVIIAVCSHKVGNGMIGLVDMAATWETLRRQVIKDDWLMATEHWQHAFQLKADFVMEDGKVAIIIGVPIFHKGAVPMTLFRLRTGPLVMDNRIMEIMPARKWLAIDEASGASATFTQSQMDACMRVTDTYLFEGGMTRYSGNSTCLEAVWSKAWTRLVQACPIISRPLREEAWAIGTHRFAIISPEEMTTAILSCQGKAERTVRLQRGLTEVVLGEGCRLAHHIWTTVEGASLRQSIRIIAVDQGLEELVLPQGMNDTSVWERPTLVGSIQEEVEKELVKSGFSTTEKIAISLTAAAVLLVLLLILALYLKARFGGQDMATLVMEAIQSHAEGVEVVEELEMGQLDTMPGK